MKKVIAILRGINVGGKRKLLMADLRAMLSEMGFSDIITYIQSGNVVMNMDDNTGNDEAADKIEKAIQREFNLDVPVVVRSADELKITASRNPYLKAGVDINKLHLTFLKSNPGSEEVKTAESYHFDPDRFTIIENDVYICCEGPFHKTKITNQFFEKKLKVRATNRNWKTVMKLLELSRS